jgi:valyl-tRNA synthetase
MEKTYQPQDFEEKINGLWGSSATVAQENSGPSFCIPMPPPNVTGALHIGHALGLSIQDALIRWKRLAGFQSLWIPGIDHAGIATQMVVERDLKAKNLTRQGLGREKFLEHVWSWKEQYGDTIFHQMKKVGASCDWSRSRFTLEPHMVDAVLTAFVQLFNDGLIEKRPAMVNRCIRCETVLSDLEVIAHSRKAHLWTIRYEAPDKTFSILIATSRPETLLADTAIAVHPDDPRFTHLHGKEVLIPLIHRPIPIIADPYVDPQFGTGALKVTPGHDFNDYALGLKHQLPCMNLLNESGKLVPLAGRFAGLSVLEARKAIIEALTQEGSLVNTQDIQQTIQVCSRCETIVEPMVSSQWFVKMKQLAQTTLHAARKGQTIPLSEIDSQRDAFKILPETWYPTFYHWLENIRDWCISRQLWWGHRIPAYTCSCGKLYVQKSCPEVCTQCQGKDITQDPDVLDTWFSSALWPFASLGWPHNTPDFAKFYPTQVLETGSDILFFWVARMLMMGQYFTHRTPFTRVYLHSMVRDEQGDKMSKTRGNVIDPLSVIQNHGADALRFSLLLACNQGQTIRISSGKIEESQAFCNKLWNAARFVLMRLEQAPLSVFAGNLTDQVLASLQTPDQLHPVHIWLLKKLSDTQAQLDKHFNAYEMTEASLLINELIWNTYCDWYIELSKQILQTSLELSLKILLFGLMESLRLAHSFIPFITEQIYQHIRGQFKDLKLEPLLMTSKLTHYPDLTQPFVASALSQVEALRSVIQAARNFRGEHNLPFKKPLEAFAEWRIQWSDSSMPGLITALVNLTFTATPSSRTTTVNTLAGPVLMDLSLLSSPLEETKRLEKQLARLQKDLEHVTGKLSTKDFLAKAPPALIEKERLKASAIQKDIDKTNQDLQSLKQS